MSPTPRNTSKVPKQSFTPCISLPTVLPSTVPGRGAFQNSAPTTPGAATQPCRPNPPNPRSPWTSSATSCDPGASSASATSTPPSLTSTRANPTPTLSSDGALSSCAPTCQKKEPQRTPPPRRREGLRNASRTPAARSGLTLPARPTGTPIPR